MLTAATPGEAHDLGAARHGEEQAGAHAEPLITEFADFEHAKENILPLREGRSAAALSLLFGPRSPAGTSSSGVAEALLAGHAAFNEELEGIDEQDDPLDVYARYIRWTVENYPQGNTPGSKLVPLLEQATRVFRDDARYRNDPRYLKIWLLYARNIQSPKDVYAYLMSNSIGTDIAAYYEDYAECLEKEGSNERADEIYRLGINRKARPLDRLSRRYKEFQYRVARAAAEDDTPEFPEIDPARAERSVLGTKSHPSSSRSVHNNVTSSALPSASSTVQRSAASRSSFSVFVGLEGTAERKRDKSMPWKDLGTDHSRRKENIREAAPWQGAKLPQSAACAPPRPAEQFKIFREEPEEARRDVQIPPANEQQVLRESKTETETSRLMKDPLRNFYSAQVATSASPPSAASPASDARPSAASPASGARLSAAFVASDRRAIHPPVPPTHGDSVKEKVTGDLQVNLDLIYQDGQEFQFEEVRLAAVGTFDLDGPEVPPWSRTAELENRELEETSRREEERQRIEFEEQQRLLSEESRRREKEERAKCDFEIERLRTEEETGRLRIGQEAEILKPAEAEVCLRIGTEVLDIGSRNNVQTTNEVAVGVHGKHPAQVNMHPHDPHHKAYLAGLGTERVSASEASSTTDFTKVTNLENKGKGPASPTINTKAALADIMEMFSQPLKNELEEASYCHAENGGQPRTARHDENEPVFRRASANPAAAGDHPHVGTASRVPLGIKQPTVVSTSSGRSFTVFRDEDADSARPVVLRASDPAAHFNGGRTPMHELRPDGERDVAPRSVPADELEWDEDDEDSALDGDNDDRDFQTLGAHFDDARVPASEDLGYATGSIGESHVELDETGKPMFDKAFECLEAGAIYHSTPYSRAFPESHAATTAEADALCTASKRFDDPPGYDDATGPAFAADDNFRSRLSPIVERSVEQSMVTSQFGDVVSAGEKSHGADVFRDEGNGTSSSSFSKDGRGNRRPDGFRPADRAADTFHGRPANTDRLNALEFPTFPDGTSHAVSTHQNHTSSTLPSPCRPHDAALIERVLASLQPQLKEYDGFVDMTHEDCPSRPELQQAAKRSSLLPNKRSSHLPVSDGPTDLRLLLSCGIQRRQFFVRRKLGTGGYGTAFLATDVAAAATDAAAGLGALALDPETVGRHRERDRPLCVLKLQAPSSCWEFYVLRQLHRRMRERAGSQQLLASVVYPTELFEYRDASLLVMKYHDHGTLLEAVNAWGCSVPGGTPGMDELLAIFFTVELMRTVEAVHACDVLHADIKPDNLLLRLEEPGDGQWASQYDPSGGGGWESKGLVLIDFGRAVDVAAHDSPGRPMRFLADWEVDGLNCTEARRGEPWRYEEDYYGIANVAYCLLHGRYLEVVEEKEAEEGEEDEGKGGRDGDGGDGRTDLRRGRFRPAARCRRYWQTDLWQELFDVLLNPRRHDGGDAASARPALAGRLRDIRRKFENYLRDSCNRGGKSLKNLLMQLEARVAADRKNRQR